MIFHYKFNDNFTQGSLKQQFEPNCPNLYQNAPIPIKSMWLLLWVNHSALLWSRGGHAHPIIIELEVLYYISRVDAAALIGC